MAKLQNYIVLLIDQDDTEDSSVILLTAENEDAAIKKIIDDRMGFDMTDQFDREMLINLSNDNPILLSEVEGSGFTYTAGSNEIWFESIYLDEETLNNLYGEIEEEDEE